MGALTVSTPKDVQCVYGANKVTDNEFVQLMMQK
jgi:hypothetical protein